MKRDGILVLVPGALAVSARVPKGAALGAAAGQGPSKSGCLDDSVRVLHSILQRDVAGNWLDPQAVCAFWTAENRSVSGERDAGFAGLAAEVIGEIGVLALVEVRGAS